MTAPADELPPGVAEVRTHIADAAPLLLSTMYHDVGKGVGRPHAQTGVPLVVRAAERLAFSDHAVQHMQFFVRSHQVMTQLAFSRDLHDERLIQQFAETVETTERLAQLYLLTIADIQAVGPNVYTEWKGALLRELYDRTRSYLEAGDHTEAAIAELRAQLIRDVVAAVSDADMSLLVEGWVTSMPERYLRQMSVQDITSHTETWYRFGERPVGFYHRAVHEGIAVDVLAKDQPGLFAKICGVLTAHGLNIVDVQAFTGLHGYVVDRFRCAGRHGSTAAPHWDRVQNDLSDVMHGFRTIDDVLQQRPKKILHPVATHLAQTSSVVVDNSVSEEYTVIDLHTQDRLGLLYDITKALYDNGCDIMTAKVMTVGPRVHDAFYIRNTAAGKITADDRIQALQEELQKIVAVG
jgi:[protein-PII] uridylyltransferase